MPVCVIRLFLLPFGQVQGCHAPCAIAACRRRGPCPLWREELAKRDGPGMKWRCGLGACPVAYHSKYSPRLRWMVDAWMDRQRRARGKGRGGGSLSPPATAAATIQIGCPSTMSELTVRPALCLPKRNDVLISAYHGLVRTQKSEGFDVPETARPR